MDDRRWQTGFFALLVLMILGAVLMTVLLTGKQSDLVSLRQEVDDLRSQTEELNGDLEARAAAVRRLREKLRATQEQVVSVKDAEAFAIEGLSADGSNFTCLDFRCLNIKATLQFFNDTDTGSPVTCVIEVHHLNGKNTHTTYTSEYVPPQGEDNQVWFYYSPLRGTEVDTYNIGDCRRDENPSSTVGGD